MPAANMSKREREYYRTLRVANRERGKRSEPIYRAWRQARIKIMQQPFFRADDDYRIDA